VTVLSPATAIREKPASPWEPEGLAERVEFLRLDASRRLDPSRRSEMGQFLTPAPVAELIASMFANRPSSVRVLDAGAGVGSLTAALVAHLIRQKLKPREIYVTAYEVEPILVEYLLETFDLCAAVCKAARVMFVGEVRKEDFIRAGVDALLGRELFPGDRLDFNAAILNPPYRKISSDSETRRSLSAMGMETSNLYTAFLWLTERLLADGGEMVAITPRSFCNGSYFKPFRKAFLQSMSFRRVHVFECRDQAFSDDEVLQENIIFRAVKDRRSAGVSANSRSAKDHVKRRHQRPRPLGLRRGRTRAVDQGRSPGLAAVRRQRATRRAVVLVSSS
jgi:adenine-specific DNA-methyltransferase